MAEAHLPADRRTVYAIKLMRVDLKKNSGAHCLAFEANFILTIIREKGNECHGFQFFNPKRTHLHH